MFALRRFATVLAVAVWICASTAQASVINFDNITSNSGATLFGGSYAGLNWGANWAVMHKADYMSSYGNTYGSPSGNYSAFNAGGILSVTTSSGPDFNFLGAYFTGWAAGNQAQYYTSSTITVNGYNNNVLVGTVSMNLSTNSYTWLNGNIMGVDRLDFLSDGNGRWWLMDDLTIQEVPVPAGVVSASIGVALMIGYSFYRKHKKTVVV